MHFTHKQTYKTLLFLDDNNNFTMTWTWKDENNTQCEAWILGYKIYDDSYIYMTYKKKCFIIVNMKTKSKEDEKRNGWFEGRTTLNFELHSRAKRNFLNTCFARWKSAKKKNILENKKRKIIKMN